MTYTDEFIKKLTNLVKVCAKVGVKEFRLAEFYVTFETDIKKSEATIPQPPIRVPVSEESKTKAENLQQDLFLQDEATAKALALERMILEDPAQYEELLASGDLEDAAKVHR